MEVVATQEKPIGTGVWLHQSVWYGGSASIAYVIVGCDGDADEIEAGVKRFGELMTGPPSPTESKQYQNKYAWYYTDGSVLAIRRREVKASLLSQMWREKTPPRIRIRVEFYHGPKFFVDVSVHTSSLLARSPGKLLKLVEKQLGERGLYRLRGIANGGRRRR